MSYYSYYNKENPVSIFKTTVSPTRFWSTNDVNKHIHPRVCTDIERRFSQQGEMVTGIGVSIDGRIDDKVIDSIVGWLHECFCGAGVKPERVILNEPATVILWSDGTKTVAKTHNGDKYNPLFGVMACVLRKIGKNRVRIDAWEDVIGFLSDHVADAKECRLMADMLNQTADVLELEGVMDSMREYDEREEPKKPDIYDRVAAAITNTVDERGRIENVEKDVEDLKSRHERTRQTIRKLIDEGEL